MSEIYKVGEKVWMRSRFGRQWFNGTVLLKIDDKHFLVKWGVSDPDFGYWDETRKVHVRRMRKLA